VAATPRNEVAPGRYHVFARGNDRMDIYRDDLDRLAWLRLFAAVAAPRGWRCEAWTLMTNHFHLLIETVEPNLGDGMQQLNGRYARGFNRRHGRRNHLFGDRFDSRPIQDDSNLLAVARYIPLNAVIAGICERPEDYPWCSYAATIGLAAAPSFLRPEGMLAVFGGGAFARSRYAAFVEDELVRGMPLALAGVAG
jgi:REP element-mobilizing transposase RayT